MRQYLDLLQMVLTNTIFNEEPSLDGDKGIGYMANFANHYINSNAISLMPLARFRNIEECILNIAENNIEGDLIETGVWRGGAVIYMKAILNILNLADRKIWVADSFEGLPVPNPEKFPLESKAHPAISRIYNNFEAGLEEVKSNFMRFNLLDDQILWLKGWFSETLPTAPIDKLSLLRLDGDYYESTMDALLNLYDKVSQGGFIIVDDYGEDSWTNCRKAIDDFRKSRNIISPLIQVDSACVYWKK